MTVVAITGHRPKKIQNWQYVETQLKHAFHDLSATLVIQGMAAGVDLVAAKVAYQNHVPFWCAKPWKTHKGTMGGSQGYVPSWEIYYEQALKHAERVIDVTDYESYPGSWVYQNRNEWMVDHGDKVVAVWDGTPGGTANCVTYAQEQGRDIWLIDPKRMTVGWL
jgi:uncharacterized phage-like protein YoqJ